MTSPPPLRRRHAGMTSYRVSLWMDGVAAVRDLVTNFPDVESFLRVHPDPVIDRFHAGTKLYRGEALILTVRASNRLHCSFSAQDSSYILMHCTCAVA